MTLTYANLIGSSVLLVADKSDAVQIINSNVLLPCYHNVDTHVKVVRDQIFIVFKLKQD